MASRYWKLGDFELVDPFEVYQACQATNTPCEAWGKANSYWCPRGPKEGVAWVLLSRRELNTMDVNGTFILTIRDDQRELRIGGLTIVRVQTIGLALEGDENSPRLIQLADPRRHLRMSAVNAQYNVRRPAPAATSGTGLYYTDSLDSGSLWTWDSLIQDLWTNTPSWISPDPPTVPYSPTEPPDGFRFLGTNTLDAVAEVAARIGCSLVYDPVALAFSLEQDGSSQSSLTGALDTDELIIDDDHFNPCTRGNSAETVRVFFWRREDYHGIEKDTPDSGNWEMSPVVSKDYATSLTGAEPGTVYAVWDDLPALYNAAGTNTNSAALVTRANEIGANLVSKWTGTDKRNRQIYGGLQVDARTGSEIATVLWRDYGDNRGLVTEVHRRPEHEITARVQKPHGRYFGSRGSGSTERLGPPDLARNTFPSYPRTDQLVQVDDDSSATGTELTANGDGLFPGYVIRWAGSAYEQLEACWIRPADLDGSVEADVVGLKQKDRLLGRLYGNETSGGTTLPIYVGRKGHPDDTQGDTVKLIEITDADGTIYTTCHDDEVSQQATDCVYRARIITHAPDSADLCNRLNVTDGADIWVRVSQTPWCEEIDDRMLVGSRFLARKVQDSFAIGETDLPFYEAAMEDSRIWSIRSQNDWTGTNNVLLYTPDGATLCGGAGADDFDDNFSLWTDVLSSDGPNGYGIMQGDKIFPIAMQRDAIEYTATVATNHAEPGTETQIISGGTLVSSPPYIDGSAPTTARNDYRFAAPIGTQVRVRKDPNVATDHEIVGVARSDPLLIEIQGSPDGSGEAAQLDGTTSLCVWDGKIVTPTATAGGLCGGGGTIVSESSVWFGLVGPTNAADPYFMTSGQKHLAYDSGNNFLPTGLADNPTNNRRLYLAERDAETHYGKALENWTQDTVVGSGGVDHVDVHPCDDAIGSNEATDQEHRVYLIRSAGKDPNVVDDDVVAYRLGMDGEYVCVSDYQDDAIGTVKMWSLSSGSIPPGWAIMDGSANSVANGGSGEINMSGRFVKGGATAGTRDGRESHIHTILIQVDPHDLDSTMHTHENTLTIYPHTIEELDHSHDIPTDTVKLEGDGNPFYPVAAENVCTKGPPHAGSTTDGVTDCTTGDWGPLHHIYELVNTPAAIAGGELQHNAGVVFVSDENHEPPNTTLIFIERINNSV